MEDKASWHPDSHHTVHLPYGAWHEDRTVSLPVPGTWLIHRMDPADGPSLSAEQIEGTLLNPIGTKRLREIAERRHSAVIVVEDITRPTQVELILPGIIRELKAGGLSEEKITILLAIGAHRPMTQEEIDRKVPPHVRGHVKVHLHDFMGDCIQCVGWVHGGPVYLNRLFLQAEMRVCVGTVMPHGETGFGGGAKLMIPGVAGHRTIAFLHGGLPPRPRGTLCSHYGRLDRRGWIEAVARSVGMDFAVCAVVNSRREITGLFTGDCVAAHRAAAECSLAIGSTPIDPEVVDGVDAVLANAYPLDTDPIQMGKGIKTSKEIGEKPTIVVNAASDGIFYHGMGMGGGIQIDRLAKNVLAGIRHPANVTRFLRGACSVRSPGLLARYVYFSFNHLSYEGFVRSRGNRSIDWSDEYHGAASDLFVYSPHFPTWGFVRRYGSASLYRDWERLCGTLMEKIGKTNVRLLVLPCAPLQIPFLHAVLPGTAASADSPSLMAVREEVRNVHR